MSEAPRAPWSTIVVGTDGSSGATGAVVHAAELAVALSAELVVVTAYEDHGGSSPAEAVPAELEWAATAGAGADDIAQQGAERARALGVKRVRARSAAGDPLEVISAAADDTGAGLIVIGSKGMRSVSRFVTGSVSNELSHHADRDLLVVNTG